MAGKDVTGKATAEPKTVARRLWRVVRAVLYMMRRGVPSGRKLAMDLHILLLRRGKIAGKALGGLASFHHHRHHAAVHEPSRGRREVEFSCSDTPASSALFAGGATAKRRGRGHHQHRDGESTGHCDYDATDIARVFEMLNDSGHLFDDDALAAATPSSFGRSPAARQLRITDSPFAAGEQQQQVDVKAEEFIRRFYEQLRAQQSFPATQDYYGAGYASRPVAAGIA